MEQEDAVELVLARLETMPDSLRVHVKDKVMDKATLIEHVRKQDSFGQALVRMQLAYIKSMTGAR